MSNGSNESRTYDPLDRTTFDAIAYNAIGRASEIGTYPALNLTHSSGNSGWSVGVVQWDFGQPGRGEKVNVFMAGYQAWASPDAQFTAEEVKSLTTRLQTKGQIGNELTRAEESRLNEYLRSDSGREFVSSLNQEQAEKKWANVGEPLSEIKWLTALRKTDPAQATEIVAQAMKLYNQNEKRGGQLIKHLQGNELTSDQTSDWIGTDGIQGLNPSARSAIVSGRDSAISGARLMNDLEQGEGRLAQTWRREIHDRGNASLYERFNSSPDVQLLDAMMRNPNAGSTILGYVDENNQPRRTVVRGINPDAALEMSRVELTPEGKLTVSSPTGNKFEMTREGWNHNGVPMKGIQPGRQAEDQSSLENSLPARPMTPDSGQHPDHAMLEQIRAHVRRLDQQTGKEYDEGSERLSRCVLAACKDNRDMYPNAADKKLLGTALERVDNLVIGKDGRYAFAVQGDLHDPAHKRVHVDVMQALQTPTEQSDAKLEAANQQISQERQLAVHQDFQRQQEQERNSPVMRA